MFAIRNATITLEMTQERLSLFDNCLTRKNDFRNDVSNNERNVRKV
jgi:hypothetical protein